MSENGLKSIRKQTSRKKLFAFKLLFLFLILLLVVGAYCSLEFLTRKKLESDRRELVPPMWQEDNLIAQSLKPNTKVPHRSDVDEFKVYIEITEQGLRDTKVYQIPKPKNIFRILMLGDSFTFGHGVEIEQTFSKVLEKSLNEKHGKQGKNFEVINAGYACGFTWDEYFLCLKERGLKYQPDVVIINAWVGNDLTDIMEHGYDRYGWGVGKQDLVRITSKTDFVSENNFRVIKKKTVPIRSGGKGIKDRINALCYKSLFCETTIWPMIDRPPKKLPSSGYLLNFLMPSLTRDIDSAWKIGQKAFLETKKISDAARAYFMIVNIPVKFEVYDPNEVIKKMLANNGFLEINNTRIEKFARENSIPYCSPLAQLKSASSTAYFSIDSHITPIGHKLVAQAIEDCLLRRATIPL